MQERDREYPTYIRIDSNPQELFIGKRDTVVERERQRPR